jgi:hypothetical protein
MDTTDKAHLEKVSFDFNRSVTYVLISYLLLSCNEQVRCEVTDANVSRTPNSQSLWTLSFISKVIVVQLFINAQFLLNV